MARGATESLNLRIPEYPYGEYENAGDPRAEVPPPLKAEKPAGRYRQLAGRVTAWNFGRLHAALTCWTGTALRVVAGR